MKGFGCHLGAMKEGRVGCGVWGVGGEGGGGGVEVVWGAP